MWRVAEVMLSQGFTPEQWQRTTEMKLARPKTELVGFILKKYLQWMEDNLRVKEAITYDYSLLKAT